MNSDSEPSPVNQYPSLDPTSHHGALPGIKSAGDQQIAVVSVLKDKPHQRVGSVSNAHVGADFERVALQYFAQQGISLSASFPLAVGISIKKTHHFDLGSADPKMIVECKSHRWTAGGRVPSAKMTVWNEAMYYFLLAPEGYRKVLFVLHDKRESVGESLVSYYARTYSHLIPPDVQILEWCEDTGDIIRI